MPRVPLRRGVVCCLRRRAGREGWGAYWRILFFCFTAGRWRTDMGSDLLCFALLRLIALGSTSEILVVWLSLSLTLSFRLGLLQSCDTRRFFWGRWCGGRGIRYGIWHAVVERRERDGLFRFRVVCQQFWLGGTEVELDVIVYTIVLYRPWPPTCCPRLSARHRICPLNTDVSSLLRVFPSSGLGS